MRRVIFALALVVGAFAAAPANAAGFLQDLFAPAPRPAPVYYQYAPAQPQMRFVYDQGFRVSRKAQVSRKTALKSRQALQRKIAKKKALLAARKMKQRAALTRTADASPKSIAPQPTKPANPSLQKALCCKDGGDPSKLIHNDATLRVGDAYMTPQGLRIYRGRASDRAAFIDYRKAGLGEQMKARLAALEDRIVRIRPPATRTALAVHAKAAAATHTSFDALGRVIRVIGPYVTGAADEQPKSAGPPTAR